MLDFALEIEHQKSKETNGDSAVRRYKFGNFCGKQKVEKLQHYE
jgi:hypothetical protein